MKSSFNKSFDTLNKYLPLFFFSFFLLSEPLFALQDRETKERMKSELDVIRSAFEAGYAPREWKAKYSGWDLDVEIAKTKDKIQNLPHPTIKAYQHLLRDFFNSMRDYHVGVFFYSTEKATLPFQVKGAKSGKKWHYYFTYVDKEKLSPSVFPIHIGDELVSFDGKPAETIIQELIEKYLRGATVETDRCFAEYFLTQRVSRLGHVVPKGPVTITVRHLGAEKDSHYQLIWNYTPEKISNGFSNTTLVSSPKSISETACDKFDMKMIDPLFEEMSADYEASPDREKLPPPIYGAKNSKIPALGRIWWQEEASSPFHAYLFETEDRKLVGYIRIPHYSCDSEEAEKFAELMRFFEERSEALVIDQTDNPGGYLYYCYALASMLTDTPLSTPLHRMAITQGDVARAVEMIPELEKATSDAEAQHLLGPDLFGLPVTYQMTRFFINFYNFIIDEWNAGHYLTDPYFLGNISHINPHPTARYTKPILILINSLDISCGDFFPAILQDNKRATLLGARTAGAGGYVRTASYPNRFGINLFRYTGSIAERIDKNPIENIGVTPDIPYTITKDDLQNNYRGYVEAIHKAIKNLK